MIGIELAKPCGALLGLCAENGLLISVTADSVVRLLPPLIMSRAEADEVIAIQIAIARINDASADDLADFIQGLDHMSLALAGDGLQYARWNNRNSKRQTFCA